jgi:iron complex transport system ATP-binding protein
MIKISQLTLQCAGKTLCQKLDLTVSPGECWAVLGQNGVGKSSLIHVLGRLDVACSIAHAGIQVAGAALSSWSRSELARQMGILLQEEPGEFHGHVREYLLLGRYPHMHGLAGWQTFQTEAVDQVGDRMELTGLMDRRMGSLSGGERQRVRIAQLLVQSPRYYLLDEPLQHLDIKHQLFIMRLFAELAREGNAVLMVLHDINRVRQYCDHVLLLFEDGHAVAGTTGDIFTRENLSALYQCDLEELEINGAAGYFMPERK